MPPNILFRPSCQIHEGLGAENGAMVIYSEPIFLRQEQNLELSTSEKDSELASMHVVPGRLRSWTYSENRISEALWIQLAKTDSRSLRTLSMDRKNFCAIFLIDPNP